MKYIFKLIQQGKYLDDNKYKLNVSFIVPALILIGTCFYSLVEQWSWIDACYFSIITLTTIGYGDLVPSHGVSKIFTVIYVLCGVTLFGYFIRKITLDSFVPFTTPALGAQLIQNNKTVSSYFRLSTDRGVVVTSLCSNGIAYSSGIRLCDVLLAVDDHEVSSEEEVFYRISKSTFGPAPRIMVARKNDITEIKLDMRK